MSRRKKIIALSAIAPILIITLVLYFLLRGPRNLTLNREFPNYSQKLLFHPDSVLGFTWIVHLPSSEKDRIFSHRRADRLSAWEPAVDPQEIQPTLNLLASLDYDSVRNSGKPIVSVELALDNKQTARGHWNGNSFVWTEGPAKGQGAELTGKQTLLFLKGDRFGESKKLSWCPARIQQMQFQMQGEKAQSQFKNVNGVWVDGLSNTPVDATQMELWMGRHCDLDIDHLLDRDLLKIFKTLSFPNIATFQFENAKQAGFRWNNLGIFELKADQETTYFVYSGHWWP